MKWFELDLIDSIRLILLCLFGIMLITLKVGGAIIVSWLWVFMPVLVFSVFYVWCSIVQTAWDKLSRFVGDD